MVRLSRISTKRLFTRSSPMHWKAPVRLGVIVAVGAVALAGCNANQTLNSTGRADLGKVYYPYYNAYDPTKYGQTSGFYAGR